MKRICTHMLLLLMMVGLSGAAFAQGRGKGEDKREWKQEKEERKLERKLEKAERKQERKLEKAERKLEKAERKQEREIEREERKQEREFEREERKQEREIEKAERKLEERRGNARGRGRGLATAPGQVKKQGGRFVGPSAAALNASKIAREQDKHLLRLARLERLQALAVKTDNEALAQRVLALRQRELARHARAMDRLVDRVEPGSRGVNR